MIALGLLERDRRLCLESHEVREVSAVAMEDEAPESESEDRAGPKDHDGTPVGKPVVQDELAIDADEVRERVQHQDGGKDLGEQMGRVENWSDEEPDHQDGRQQVEGVFEEHLCRRKKHRHAQGEHHLEEQYGNDDQGVKRQALADQQGGQKQQEESNELIEGLREHDVAAEHRRWEPHLPDQVAVLSHHVGASRE